MAAKVDLKKELTGYTAPCGDFELLTLEPRRYLMVDGAGDPNTSQAYREALESLYPIAYTLKFFSKRELDRDYIVMPLEGLWWAEEMESFTTARDKSAWSWTMLLGVPAWLTDAHVAAAHESVTAAGKAPAPERVRLGELDEGLCVQTLHLGAYDDEGPVLERMHHEFVPAQGLELRGTHHEIYLSDPRRTAPEKLKTILRQPVRPVG